MQKEKKQKNQKGCRSYSDSVPIRKQNIKSISCVRDSVAVNQNVIIQRNFFTLPEDLDL